MKPRRLAASCAVLALLGAAAPRTTAAGETARLRFAVRFPESLSREPLDGRLLLLIAASPATEPRFQVRETDGSRSRARRRCSTGASSATRPRPSAT
jgi:hypothetical protein